MKLLKKYKAEELISVVETVETTKIFGKQKQIIETRRRGGKNKEPSKKEDNLYKTAREKVYDLCSSHT